MFELKNKNVIGSVPKASLSGLVLLLSLSGCGSDSAKEPTPVADTTAPTISLTGESALTVEHGTSYAEQGASATDNVDGTVTATPSGTVDTMTLGTYTITYTATDAAGNESTATRTVDVVDTTNPVVTLTGDAAMTIYLGQDFVDPSATALDAVDGSIDVTRSGTVDSSTLGDYVITYSGTDASGNEHSQTRTVTVAAPMLSGTAAAGAAIIGTVTVKGALGNQKSQLIEADGSYEVDVTGLTAPYRLRAQGTVGGKTYQLHSYAESATADTSVNITPFTDLIVANAAQQVAASFFESANTTSIEPADLAEQENALQEKLQDVFDALGVGTAIDLLNTSFSADHSGLDAALDVIQIESTAENIVTITNLIDGTSITDDVTATDDNEESLSVDTEKLTTTVSDTVAIADLFNSLSAAYAAGLPASDDIEDLFSSDFIDGDNTLAEFLTDITTDPSMVGISFASVSIEDIDITNKTATVKFNAVFDGVVDPETESWLAAKDDTLGWQLRGNQRIVDINELHFHCNEYDPNDEYEGSCGINVYISDENFTNNGTDGAPIQSATVNVIDGTDGTTVKATIYMGVPEYSVSELSVYNNGSQQYHGDYASFGSQAGDLDPSVFEAGDIIEYNLYTADLDLTDPTAPAVTGSIVRTYTSVINYAPSLVGLYPTASAETIAAVDSIATWPEGQDLTVEWTLQEGTQIDEILVEFSGAPGNYSQYWEEALTVSDTSVTVDSSVLNTELFTNPNFDFSQGYEFIVRIYSIDVMTGQIHSTDYRKHVPFGGTAPPPLEPPSPVDPTGYICSFETGWDDSTDMPTSFESFANYETVVADCGGVLPIVAADFAGKSFMDGTETNTFNDDGAATEASPNTGVFNDNAGEVVNFEWYIETVNANSYLVVTFSDSETGFELRDTMALITVNGTKGTVGSTLVMKVYSEQTDFPVTDMVRLTGTDGEIWGGNFVQQ